MAEENVTEEKQDEVEQEANAIDRERSNPVLEVLKEAYTYCENFNYSPTGEEDSLGTQIGQVAGRIQVAIIKLESGYVG